MESSFDDVHSAIEDLEFWVHTQIDYIIADLLKDGTGMIKALTKEEVEQVIHELRKIK